MSYRDIDVGVDQALSVERRIRRLDAALRLWAVRTYQLVEAGPPPVYQLPWDPEHAGMVRGWQRFCNDWSTVRRRANDRQYTPSERNLLERYAVSLDKWQKVFDGAGVQSNDAAVGKMLAEGGPSSQAAAMPWTNTLAICGGLAFAAYIGAPYLRSMLQISPDPIGVKPVSIDYEAMKKAVRSPQRARQFENLAKARDARKHRLRAPDMDDVHRQLQSEYGESDYFESGHRGMDRSLLLGRGQQDGDGDDPNDDGQEG